MYHNGGYPPIFEGGKKEILQREFSAENVLSISQILNSSNRTNLVIKRIEPVVFNLIDKEPSFNKKMTKQGKKLKQK